MHFCVLQLFLISQRTWSDFVHNFSGSKALKGLIRSDGLPRVWPCGQELLEGCALIIRGFGKQTVRPGFTVNLKKGKRLLKLSEILKCDEISLYMFDHMTEEARQKHLKLFNRLNKAHLFTVMLYDSASHRYFVFQECYFTCVLFQ